MGVAARYGRGLLTFTEPSAVEAALGDGSLRDLLVSALWIAKTTVYALALEGTIAGVLSAVTPGAENGGTGLVAVAGGPRNEYNVLVEILSSGGLNEAVFLVTIDGLPGKRLTVPDAPGTYPIPETGITLTFEPGAEGFAAGDTFVFASTEPSAANGEVPEAVNTILDAKPNIVMDHGCGRLLRAPLGGAGGQSRGSGGNLSIPLFCGAGAVQGGGRES